MFKRILINVITFAFALTLGLFGRSAHNIETAEFGAAVVSVKGTPPATVTEQPEEPAAEYDEITVTATAYCPCKKCCGKTDGITSTGAKATAGRTIAVDPSIIPYGTEVIINGHTYVAEDCGGAVKGNDIDIFFNSHEEALQFGRQTIVAAVTK